jgi:hypothetical protein
VTISNEQVIDLIGRVILSTDQRIIIDGKEYEVFSDWYAHERYDEHLDEIYGVVQIGGYHYDTSRALKEVDPIAYRVGFSDWVDELMEEQPDILVVGYGLEDAIRNAETVEIGDDS